MGKANDWLCRDCQYQNTGHSITNCKGRGCNKTTPLHVLRRAGIVPSGQRGGGPAARGHPQAAGKPNTSGTSAAATTGGGAPADLLARKLRVEVEARKSAEQRLAVLQAAADAAAAKPEGGDGMQVDSGGAEAEAPDDEVKVLRAQLAYFRASPSPTAEVKAGIARIELELQAATLAKRTGRPLREQLASNGEYIGRLRKKRATQVEDNKRLLAVLAQAQLELTEGQAKLKATDDEICQGETEMAVLTQRIAAEDAKGAAASVSSPAAAAATVLVQLQGAMDLVQTSTQLAPQLAQTVAMLCAQLNEAVAASAAASGAPASPAAVGVAAPGVAGAAPVAPPGSVAPPPAAGNPAVAVVAPVVPAGAQNEAAAAAAAAAPAAAAAGEAAAAASSAAAAAPAGSGAQVVITPDEQMVLDNINKRGGGELVCQQMAKKR